MCFPSTFETESLFTVGTNDVFRKTTGVLEAVVAVGTGTECEGFGVLDVGEGEGFEV